MSGDRILEAYAIGALTIGFLTCFYGFRLFEYLLGAVGFLVGAGIGASLGEQMAAGSLTAVVGGGLLGGIAGAIGLVYIFPLALALFGFLFGALAGSAVNSMAGLSQEPLLVLLFGAVAAVLALMFKKFLIVVSTSFDGAGGVVWGGLVLLRSFQVIAGDPYMAKQAIHQSRMLTVLWLVIGGLGVLIQYQITAPERHHLRRLEEDYWQEKDAS